MHPFRSAAFWFPFLASAVVAGLLFGWEAGVFSSYVPSFQRPPLTQLERALTIVMVFLFALNAGLFAWQRRYGSCPAGVRRATGLAGIFGAAALLCPACTVIPLTLLGTSLTLSFLTPFLPLLRLLTVIILLSVTFLLWPKRR